MDNNIASLLTDPVDVIDLPYQAPPPSKTGWACIIRYGGVGDNLIAASVLRPLKAMGYKIDVLSQEPQCSVFENNPFIDKLSIKHAQRDTPQGDMFQWHRFHWSRGKEYDLCVNLSHSCEALLAQFPASAPFWWPSHFRRKLCGHNYLETVHDIVGVAHEFGPLFFPTEGEQLGMVELRHRLTRKKVIGWCLTGSRVDKVYPMAPIAVARLIKDLDCEVVLFGAPGRDHEFAEQIKEHVERQNGTSREVHIAISDNIEKPNWPIRRILTLAMNCDLVIGPDTGPMWAVAMEPVPKIVLHSHASVENICKHWVNTASLSPKPDRVPCWPCHMLHDYIDSCQEQQQQHGMKVDLEAKGAACISSIDVESIVTIAGMYLYGDRKSHDYDSTRRQLPVRIAAAE
jgi:ADP-heptose:LPS heptosyltransferase